MCGLPPPLPALLFFLSMSLLPAVVHTYIRLLIQILLSGFVRARAYRRLPIRGWYRAPAGGKPTRGSAMVVSAEVMMALVVG